MVVAMTNKRIIKKQNKKIHIKRRLFFFVVVPIAALGAIYYETTQHILINVTNSMPIGVYEKMPVDTLNVGDVVSFCLDDDKAKLALDNNIMAHNRQCDNGSEMLIKEIIAVPTDLVIVKSEGMEVDYEKIHYLYPAPRYSFSPRTHKPVLTLIDTGKYKSTGYWMYGEYNYKNSWDSRYFGQVSRSNIINKLDPLFIWE